MADTLTLRRASAPPAPAVGSTFAFDAIGTRWCIDTDEPLGGEVRDWILDRIRRFDRTYSRFRPDSLVAQVAAAPAGRRFEFPEDSVALFDLYDRLVAATDGAVDPLVGRQLELLGYDPTYSLTPAPPAVRARERARSRPSWAADIVRDGATLITRRPLVIDVGAAGKGYLVDIISAILQQAGMAEFVVDAGGDLRHRGEHDIRVGLEHPRDPLLEAVDLHGAHDFRHTFATWLEDAGIPARVIDEVMGHEATSRAGQQRGSAMGAHYRHTTREMAARIATGIEQRLTVVLEVAEQALEAQPHRSTQRVL